MSDPVTNIEIEDVLSSIRRLVAESERPVDRLAERSRALSGLADRLMLTPALRIAEPPVPAAPVSDLAAKMAMSVAPAPDVPAATRAAGLESALALHLQDWEPDGSEAGAARLIAPAAFLPGGAPQPEPEPEPEAEPFADAVLDWSAPAPDDSPVMRSALSPVAMPIPPANGPVAAVVQPVAALVQPVVAVVQPVATVVQPVAALVQPVATVVLPVAAVVQPVVAVVQPVAAVVQPVAQPSAAVVQPVALAQPQTDDDKGEAGLDDDLALAEAVNADQPAGDAIAGLLRAGVIDEELLRNLVFDIVRQELQGTLGERITRNVRKLVRREIYRVLSSQEFE